MYVYNTEHYSVNYSTCTGYVAVREHVLTYMLQFVWQLMIGPSGS